MRGLIDTSGFERGLAGADRRGPQVATLPPAAVLTQEELEAERKAQADGKSAGARRATISERRDVRAEQGNEQAGKQGS